jgi:glucosamine--fructose-6-phosphate aminotransferase (isomerizing)
MTYDVYVKRLPPLSDRRIEPMTQLPRWALALKERHPDGELPTRDRPIPDWLAAEVEKVPLWYIIREAEAPRTAHPFIVLDEINREPGQWTEIIATMQPAIDAVADAIVNRGIERIIFTGCGSAYFTAMHGEFAVRTLGAIDTQAIESFELANYFPDVDPGTTLVVAHSGTGGSIETIEAIEAAAAHGCMTLALSNTPNSNVVRAADHALIYETRQACGPCISVISTRVLVQTLLGLALGARRGATENAAAASGLGTLAPVGQALIDTHQPTIWELAKRFKGAESFLLVGSGPNYFSAREGTLKIEEQAILVGKAYRTGDFHHDALSLVAPNRVVIAIEAAGPANARVIDAVRAANEGESPTIAVTWSGGPGAKALEAAAGSTIAVSGNLPEILSPIPLTLVFQLLGYYLGVERGYNPDTLRTDHGPNTRAWLTSFPLGTH